MGLFILSIDSGAVLSVLRPGSVRLSGEAPMELHSGDRLLLGPYSDAVPNPRCVLGHALGSVFASVGAGVEVNISFYQFKWRGFYKEESSLLRLLPPPFDQWLETIERFLPSVFGLFRRDLEASGEEWLGPFWVGLPDGNLEIVPLSIDLNRGTLVGTVSGVGDEPALHRLHVPGAWYETRKAVYLARVGEAGPEPECWRTVELFCDSGDVQVEPRSSQSPVVLSAGQGVRFQVRQDGTTSQPELLDSLPGDVQTAIAENAFGWLDLTGGANYVVESVSPGEGVFRVRDEDLNTTVNLGEVLAQNVDPARWNADVSPYLLGLRMLSGVAENEAAMFEKVSGSGVDGVAGFHTWMQDVRPGDQVKLFLRLPLSEPPQNMAPSKEKR